MQAPSPSCALMFHSTKDTCQPSGTLATLLDLERPKFCPEIKIGTSIVPEFRSILRQTLALKAQETPLNYIKCIEVTLSS